MVMEIEAKPFSKWRNRLWPVHSYENNKVFALLLMKFCASFNYTILHATKDTLIVTTKGSGAEAIPILKGWFVVIFAFIFMLLYSKMSNLLTKSRLFYATLAPFLVFFAVYGLFLYPNREWLAPHQTADWIQSILGNERSHWIAIYRYWMDAIFFLMAEMWGGVVIALLFWGFANRINSINEASRFYTLLSAGGHIGVIIAGPIIYYFASSFGGNYLYTVQSMMTFVTLVNILMIGTYWFVNNQIVKGIPENKVIQSNESTKLSMKDSLKHIFQSPYLGAIALMVIGYSISVNMVEVLWKGILKIKYPDSNDYQAFMGIVSSIIGALSLFLALFVGGNTIRTFGWHFAAQITPIILGIASVAFLGVYFTNSFPTFGAEALIALVLFGAIHNVACKSMKYCFFDPTKEMAYIPLDDESKVKGKAAVDLVASRVGKSGSSWIQIALMELLGVGSVLSIAPYLAPFIIVTIITWMGAGSYLKDKVTIHRKVKVKPTPSPT